MITSGEIGTIVIGDTQIGGFLNWQIDSHVEAHQPLTIAEISGFWLFEAPWDDIVMKFYSVVGHKLVLISQNKTNFKLEGYTLNEINYRALEFMLNEYNEL